jgi:hypothetical protein
MGEQTPKAVRFTRRALGVRVAAGLFILTTVGLVASRAIGWVPFSWLEHFQKPSCAFRRRMK